MNNSTLLNYVLRLRPIYGRSKASSGSGFLYYGVNDTVSLFNRINILFGNADKLFLFC